MTVINNSSFLDAYGAELATTAQIQALQNATDAASVKAVLDPLYSNDLTVAEAGLTERIVVGLVLDRAQSADGLMEQSWAARQAVVADQTSTWTTYGADPGTYQSILTSVQQIASSAGNVSGYISSAQDRTIWVTLDRSEFQQLFGTKLLSLSNSQGEIALAWAGNLNLDASIPAGIRGLWFEQQAFIGSPNQLNTTGVALVGPLGPDDTGPLSEGNAAGEAYVNAMPTALPDAYNYPLDASQQTPSVALVEAVVPLTPTSTLAAYYNQYRTEIGLQPVAASDFVVASGSQTTPYDTSMQGNVGEMALDISVLAGAAPKSAQLLYQYYGGTPYNAYQNAFFDAVNGAPVLSSSYAIDSQPTQDSPFQWAFEQLFVDGALNNVSTHVAAGDTGSTSNHYTGVANLNYSLTATTALIVGGTSLANRASAEADRTLAADAALAVQGDPAIIFALVASGLRTLPANLANAPSTDPAATFTPMFESVWNGYEVIDDHGTLIVGLGGHNSGTGGVNTSLPVPDYQSDFGLTPTSTSGTGRGVPDVAVLAAGDTEYANLDSQLIYNDTPPSGSLINTGGTGGTSAAAPLWAGLTARFDAIFADQNLPNLGFYNDLLYTSAAIAPASFNDITTGNNIDSFVYGQFDNYQLPASLGGYDIVPTHDGYNAGPGYDLASGLGSPNGVILARTLTAVAHAQISSTAPAVMNVVDALTGTSTVAQTLLVQNNFTSDVAGATKLVHVLGTDAVDMGGNSALGWTSRLAEQVVQGDNFDSALVTLLDGAAKSVPYEIGVQAGDMLGVSADGTPLALYQQLLTNDYGFIQFGDAGGGITLARPVAIAQTAGGASDQNAILRIRQNGGDATQLEIYKVDDLVGTVGGLAPGQAGYAAAAAARDYHTLAGDTVIDGPGWGNFMQVEITGVNPGDIMALKYADVTTSDVYWAFSQANPNGVTTIFNYGLNTWGFEDRPLTGDHDFQDLVVQIDFTSAAGHGLLV